MYCLLKYWVCCYYADLRVMIATILLSCRKQQRGFAECKITMARREGAKTLLALCNADGLSTFAYQLACANGKRSCFAHAYQLFACARSVLLRGCTASFKLGWEPGQIHTPRFAGSRSKQSAASEKMVTCNQPVIRETRRHVRAMLYMNLFCQGQSMCHYGTPIFSKRMQASLQNKRLAVCDGVGEAWAGPKIHTYHRHCNPKKKTNYRSYPRDLGESSHGSELLSPSYSISWVCHSA